MKIPHKDIVLYSYESFYHKFNSNNNYFYLILLSILLVSIGSLPFIYIDINIKTPGVIDDIRKNQIFKAPENSKIIFTALKENKKVNKGDTLLILKSDELNLKLSYLNNESERIKNLITNFELLINGEYSKLDNSEIIELKNVFEKEETLLKQQIEKDQRAYLLNLKLYNKTVISENEFITSKQELDKAKNNLKIFISKQSKNWTTQLNEYKIELAKLQNELNKTSVKSENLIFISSSDGYLKNTTIKGIGERIYANDNLYEFIFSDSLYAFLQIPANKIGLVKNGMTVNLFIDTYNYNTWGSVESQLIDISKDLISSGNNRFYLATCKLSSNEITLKNKFHAELKKGMTLNANLLLNRRSLFNLLSDKIIDWLNPNVQ